jgi:hypothetical protein
MEGRTFFTSTGGQVGSITWGFALAAAGAMAFAGPGEHMLVSIPAILLACIVGAIFTVGLTVGRFSGISIALVIALPFVAGFFFFALHHVVNAGPIAAVALLAAGAATIVLATIGRLPSPGVKAARTRRATHA